MNARWAVHCMVTRVAEAVATLRRVRGPKAGKLVAAAAVTMICCVCACAGSAVAAARWQPPQHLTWYWQLTGTPKVEPVQATDIDGFDNSAATVASFHARGQRMICYIDAGTAENWRPDYSKFPASVLGSSNGWPGEQWLDIRQLSVLEPIMAARFQMCAQKGFDAVEPDNIDGYENSTGFPLTAADQLAYNEWIAQEVHSLGMAVFQKNDPDQASSLEPYFDGVIDEQCNQYSECGSYQPYLAAGKPVLNAEYQSSGFCGADRAAGIMGALFSTGLDGSVYSPCFGPSTTTPITSPSGSTPPARGHRGPPPRVTIAAGPLTGRHGLIRVALRCAAGQSYCAGSVGITTVSRFRVAKRRIRVGLGQARFRVRRGRTAVVMVRLPRSALRQLGRHMRLSVIVSVTARDAAGRRGGSQRTARLKILRGR
jgi:hypothetical protein